MLNANPFLHPGWVAAVAAGTAEAEATCHDDELTVPSPVRRHHAVRIRPFARVATVEDAYGTVDQAHYARAALRDDSAYFARKRTPDDWIFPHDPIWFWRDDLREMLTEIASYYRIRRDSGWLPQIRLLRAEHTRLVGVERAADHGARRKFSQVD